MTTFQTLTAESRDGVRLITLNRPAEANAVNRTMAHELAVVASSCELDESIRAVVLTATGRFFCAGGDVKAMAASGDAVASEVRQIVDDFHRAISAFSRMSAPVIVAVNGAAAGAGFSLAVAGDLVIAADTATFTMSYTNVGLSPDGSSSYFLPRLIGLRKTQELMLTNRRLTAQQAQEWGLVTHVVPGPVLMEEAHRHAAMLALGSRRSNACVKKLLLATYANGLETQMEIEGRYIAGCASAADGREGVRAFVEKRPARFG